MGCSASNPPEIEVTPDESVKVDNKSPATEVNDVKDKLGVRAQSE